MRKKLAIHLLAPMPEYTEVKEQYGSFVPTTIFEDEFPNIYIKHKITDEEWLHAMNTIITYMMQHEYRVVEVDLDKRNEDLDPINKLSLEELRKEYMKLKKRMASLDCKGGPFFDSTKK